jgi:neutral amino acid transport system ATP-binding protein
MPADPTTSPTAPGFRPGAAALAAVEARPGVPKPDPILIADHMTREFGGLKAVNVEHLEVQRGCITALIGPNGAGKTTFFNLMTGFDKPTSGTWSLNKQDLGSVNPHEIARKGMVRTFQLTKALTRLSVMQNMRLGDPHHPGERMFQAIFKPLWSKHEDALTARAGVLLERFKLDHMRDEFAGTLSGGQRKLLEMARALMVEPELVMLDEPMAGVNPALTESLLDHVKELPGLGMTVVFVEHDMDVVMDISDWVVVMAQGRIIAEGPPEAIAKNEEVVEAYLGAHHDDRTVFDDGPARIAIPGGAAASDAASERARAHRLAMGSNDPTLPRAAGGAPRAASSDASAEDLS